MKRKDSAKYRGIGYHAEMWFDSFNKPSERTVFLKVIICWLMLLVTDEFSAQSPAQYLKAGEDAVEDGNWEMAFSYFEQGYKIDTTSFDLCRNYADAARMIRNYRLASSLYEKNYTKDNGKIYPDGLFWLALMQKYEGRYEDAQRNFKKYLKKHKAQGSRDLVHRAEHEAKSALWAMDYRDKDFDGEIIHPEKVNTISPEISPFVLQDRLYFNTVDEIHENSWLLKSAEIKSLQEINSVNIPGFGKDESIGNLKGNADGLVYFSVSKNGASKIYSATLNNEMVVDVEEVTEANGSGLNNTMPAPAWIHDQYYLFFVSDREGGQGGKDIWYIKSDRKKDESGSHRFGKAKNLGSAYNTEGDELSPFFIESAFYFSSDWHDGFGGQDIFEVKVDDFLTGKPLNMGRPYNSSANDFYFIKSGRYAWFSSNREGSIVADSNATCCNDLYQIVYQEKITIEPEDNGKIISLQDINNELPVVLYFHNDEPVPDSWDTTTTLSYLDAYNSYLSKVPVYLKENTRGLNGDRKEEAESITNDFFELKVKKGVSDLNEFSDLLLKELQKGRSLDVSVRGFASPRAQTDYNLNLTKRRTSSLVNFMLNDSMGVFKPFMDDTAQNGARLTFTLLPFGEYKADKAVSDDLTDEKNSIYNRSACLERKIEIESVKEIPATQRKVELKLETDSFSFGRIPKLGTVKRQVRIDNFGNKPMVIDSVLAECGCTDPKLDKSIVLPGEYATMEVSFTPFGYKGHVTKHIMLYVAGEEPKLITFDAEIE